MTVREVRKYLSNYADGDEVRFDLGPNTTDQTEQEIVSWEALTDEDGREYVCIHVENT